MLRLRPERPADHQGIGDVHDQAFGGRQESLLVEALRAEGSAILALVAEDDDGILGHVMFSRMEAPFRALGLGPVGVRPARQRAGIGTALIRRAITDAAGEGWDAIFVVGDPAYYRRFGFDPQAASGFESPYAGPYLMMLPLGTPASSVRTGKIEYAPAFASLS
jgi:putative acetyltransferase